MNIIPVITENFKPAESLADADELKTTADICELVASHTGYTIDNIPGDEVAELLQGRGYLTHRAGDKVFWLLKRA